MVPRADDPGYIGAVLGLCSDLGASLVAPSTELEIAALAGARGEFESRGIGLLVNDDAVLDRFSLKSSTHDFFAGAGLGTPETWAGEGCLDRALSEGASFPLVVKSDGGCGSRGLCVAGSAEEARGAVSRIPDPIVQRYVGTAEEEYTVGVFSDGSECRSIAFRRRLGYGGMSVSVRYVRDGEIDKIARRVAERCGLRGCINLQMRRDGGGYSTFEVNPRISSTVAFRNAAGFRDCTWWAALALYGEAPAGYAEPEPFVGVRTLGVELFPADSGGAAGRGPDRGASLDAQQGHRG